MVCEFTAVASITKDLAPVMIRFHSDYSLVAHCLNNGDVFVSPHGYISIPVMLEAASGLSSGFSGFSSQCSPCAGHFQRSCRQFVSVLLHPKNGLLTTCLSSGSARYSATPGGGLLCNGVEPAFFQPDYLLLFALPPFLPI